jgi:DNA-binding CsgD family transcriptional regulator/tetratricopeptide (TPR) repeat protein
VPRLSSAVFVGRKQELSVLTGGLEAASSGTPAAVIVGGEAGVGKSRLLEELAAFAETAGVRTLTGACVSLIDSSAPLLPVIGALRQAGGDSAMLGPLDDDPPPGALGPAWSGALRRYELLDAHLKRLAAEQPVLLVLEDIHWADSSTLEFVMFLLRGLQAQTHRLMVVATYRSEDAVRRPELRTWLAEVGRMPLARRLELTRFTRREQAAQLEGILGAAAQPELVERIFARSEGNAFIAEELLAAAKEGRDDRLPETLRDALSARLVDLSEDSRMVLRAAATAGRRVDHRVLAAVVDLPEPALSRALREPVQHQVLLVDRDGTGYVFRHALLQEFAYSELLPGERQQLHAGFAEALERQFPAREMAAPVAAEISQHWVVAQEPRRALAAAVRAGLAAEQVHAMAEARVQFDRALELWLEIPDAAAVAGIGHVDLLAHAAETAAAAGAHERALELVERARTEVSNPVLLGALMERRASFLRLCGRRAEALVAFEEAIRLAPAEPPTAEAARVRAAYGRFLMIVGRHADARATCEAAAELARRAGAVAEEAMAMASLGSSLVSLGEHDEGLATLREAERIAWRGNAPEYPLIAATYLADALDRAGRFEEAVRTALATRQDCRRLGYERTYGVLAANNAAAPLLHLGRWPEADQLLTEALGAGGAPAMAVFATLRQAEIATARGAFADAARLLAQASAEVAEVTPDSVSLRAACVAELERWQGRFPQARTAVEDGLRSLGEGDDPLYFARVVAAGVRVEADVAERALARRRPADAQEAKTRAELYFEHLAATAPATGTEPAALRATIDAECSRLVGVSDVARWERAVEANERWGSAYPIACTRFRLAEALLAAAGAREHAAALLREAHASATALEARPLREQIEGLARRARIDLVPVADPVAAPAPEEAPFGLTEREVEVLRHIAAGATNRQIGEALFISGKTAGAHVSNILRKLSASSRAEAAAIALRAGVVSGDPPGRGD